VIHHAYIGLGANLGDAAATVERAIEALGSIGRVAKRSSLYRTQPWGNTDQPPFVNAVALLETQHAPRALLEALKLLEVELGRTPTERWGPRVIDLDILTYDDLTLNEPTLHIPHTQLHARGFVLVPLAEIDDRYVALRDALPPSELAGVERLNNPLSP
jgi:2-amino-4-hydroxy-6-hydroxymethyldihydropteridine diphosphokinase